MGKGRQDRSRHIIREDRIKEEGEVEVEDENEGKGLGTREIEIAADRRGNRSAAEPAALFLSFQVAHV